MLEAANFAGPSILRTEMHTGIRSEASNRFEKGIDANLVPGGLDFADRLFAELCGGTVAPGMVDAGGVPPAPAPLAYRPGKADALLGYDVPAAEQAGILRRLECEVDEAGGWDATPVGGHAADVPARPHPRGRPRRGGRAHRRLRHGARDAAAAHHRRRPDPGRSACGAPARRALAGCGLDEAITYTFIAPDALAPLGLPEDDARLDPVRLSNPMSVEQSVMRTMLLPGLLGAVRDNVDRLNDPPNLFEIGKVYLWDEPVPAPEHAAEPGAVLPHEPEALGIVLSGPLEAENWTGAGRATDFYTLKGAVDAALAAVGLRGEYAPLGDAAEHFPYLHPGKAALVSVAGAGGVGALGQLRPGRGRRLRRRRPRRVLRLAQHGPARAGGAEDAGVRGPRHVPAGLPGPRGRGRPRRAGGGGRRAGTPRRRQARPQRPRLRRVRGRPGRRPTSARWRCASSCALRIAR